MRFLLISVVLAATIDGFAPYLLALAAITFIVYSGEET